MRLLRTLLKFFYYCFDIFGGRSYSNTLEYTIFKFAINQLD